MISTGASFLPPVRRLSLLDGSTVEIYDTVKAKVTFAPRSPIEAQMRSANATESPADCGMGSRITGHENLAGVDVVISKDTAGTRRFTNALAPRLGCELLHNISEMMRPNGSFYTTAETKVAKLEIGEPEPRLFEIGVDLVEMKPSEARKRILESIDWGELAEHKAEIVKEMERDNAEAP